MAFRRYGGDWSGGKDGTSKKIASIGIYLLVICSALTLLTGHAGFILFGFLAMFVIMMLVTGTYDCGFNVRGGRNRFYLDEALRFYNDGSYEQASDSFRKAKRYGDIPPEYEIAYRKVSSR